MAIQFTTPQLTHAVQQVLERLISTSNPDQPNLHLCPRLVSCDGPSLTVELEHETKPWTSNPMEIVHGGVLAMIIDNAMGLTCRCLYDHFTPTIQMSILYSRPVPLHETIRLRVVVTMAGSTTAQLQAQIYLPSQPNRILVSASGVYCSRTK